MSHRRHRPANAIARTIVRYVLAALLLVAGASHLARGRRGYRIVVPDWAVKTLHLDKDAIVIGSGVVELMLGASLVALPREKRTIGMAVAAFFVAVLPGNVHQWRTGRNAPMLDTDRKRFVRLFLQIPLVIATIWSTR